jgi:hypothetical protein
MERRSGALPPDPRKFIGKMKQGTCAHLATRRQHGEASI